MKIGIFYGSTNGNTAEAARMMQQQLSADIYDVGKLKNAQDVVQYDLLIFGTSTWYDGDLQDDWEGFMTHLSQIDLQTKNVALFGMGDQEGYGSNFVSAMRLIYDQVLKQGAHVIGTWEDSGYAYEHSEAIIEGKFVGLALDEDNQSELTTSRIETWCRQLMEEARIRA